MQRLVKYRNHTAEVRIHMYFLGKYDKYTYNIVESYLLTCSGSWRPIGHMRPSSPLLDSVRDQFEDYDQLAKDFTRMFLNSESNTLTNAALFDVVFLVGQSKQKVNIIFKCITRNI